MKEAFVYYESKNYKDDESTQVNISLFDSWPKARAYMNIQRDEYISKYGLIPDSIDGLPDKTWVRLYITKDKKQYMDLITNVLPIL